jgi:hypothetical protein
VETDDDWPSQPDPVVTHDHLGPLCFRPELHEENFSEKLSSIQKTWTDEALLGLFRQALDASAPHCPVCRRFGLKSGFECNVISCRCGAEWCFMCSKQIFHSVRDYTHARLTHPERTAFMLERAASSSHGQLAPVAESASSSSFDQRLSSTNHHGCFATAPEPYRHDPSDPGKDGTLCPSTLEQLATTYQLPEFVEIREAYHNRTAPAVSISRGIAGNREDDVQDGLELRLMPAFLRLCAVRALKTLQTRLAPDVFLRGLRLMPEWPRDIRLCAQLGIEPLPSLSPPVKSTDPTVADGDQGLFAIRRPQVRCIARNCGSNNIQTRVSSKSNRLSDEGMFTRFDHHCRACNRTWR